MLRILRVLLVLETFHRAGSMQLPMIMVKKRGDDLIVLADSGAPIEGNMHLWITDIEMLQMDDVIY